jgi:hypothetical protein
MLRVIRAWRVVMPRLNRFVHLNSAMDADLAAIAKRAEKFISLAVDKAIAHTIDSSAFPVESGSLEHVLAQRLQRVPPANDKKAEGGAAIDKEVAQRIRTAQARWRTRYTTDGRLKPSNPKFRAYLGPYASSADLTSKKHIAQQIPADFFFGPSSQAMKTRLRALARPLDPNVPASVDAYEWFRGLIGAGDQSAAGPPAKTRAECLIREIKCVDETTGFCGTEAGSDEISLGGMSIDPCAVVRRIAGSHIKDYGSDGETKTYPPPDYKLFAEYTLQTPGEWPRVFFATFVLAEKDMGGLGEFLSTLVDLVRARLAAELAASLGPEVAAALVAAGTAGAVAAAVAIVLMIVVFVIVLAIFEAIKRAWEDDVFEPQTVAIPLENLAAADSIDYPSQGLWGIVNFVGHGGHYQLFYSWRCS